MESFAKFKIISSTWLLVIFQEDCMEMWLAWNFSSQFTFTGVHVRGLSSKSILCTKCMIALNIFLFMIICYHITNHLRKIMSLSHVKVQYTSGRRRKINKILQVLVLAVKWCLLISENINFVFSVTTFDLNSVNFTFWCTSSFSGLENKENFFKQSGQNLINFMLWKAEDRVFEVAIVLTFWRADQHRRKLGQWQGCCPYDTAFPPKLPSSSSLLLEAYRS